MEHHLYQRVLSSTQQRIIFLHAMCNSSFTLGYDNRTCTKFMLTTICVMVAPNLQTLLLQVITLLIRTWCNSLEYDFIFYLTPIPMPTLGN